jgi:transglutaminase-like putative cysteine protease
VLVKDLAADLGVRGALASKAEALLRAWGVPAWEVFADLGDPRLLVSTRRAEIIALRDRWHD